MRKTVFDQIDADSMSVAELVEVLSGRGVELDKAWFVSAADVEFQRYETDAEQRKRESREAKAAERARLQQEKKRAAEYKEYLRLAKKYGA